MIFYLVGDGHDMQALPCGDGSDFMAVINRQPGTNVPAWTELAARPGPLACPRRLRHDCKRRVSALTDQGCVA